MTDPNTPPCATSGSATSSSSPRSRSPCDGLGFAVARGGRTSGCASGSDSSTSWTRGGCREAGHDDVEERLDAIVDLDLLVEPGTEGREQLEPIAHDPLRVVEQDALERLAGLLREAR